jgi:hypothetical protein
MWIMEWMLSVRVRRRGLFTNRRRDFSRSDKPFRSRFLAMEPMTVVLPPLRVLDEFLTRIIHRPVSLMNNPPFGLRLRSFRSPLRVSLERGVKQRVETHKKAIGFAVGAHLRTEVIVNEAG